MIVLETAIAQIQKELGSFFGNEAHPDIHRYINSAGNYIYNYRDWGWNKRVYTFIYGSPGSEVTIPYMVKIFSVKKDRELVYLYNSEEWFETEDHADGVGVFGDKFIADAGGTYQMLYTPLFPNVDSTSTEIDLPANFADILKAIAVHFAYKDIKNYETAMPLLSQANAMMDSASERTVNNRPRQPTRIGSRHSF